MASEMQLKFVPSVQLAFVGHRIIAMAYVAAVRLEGVCLGGSDSGQRADLGRGGDYDICVQNAGGSFGGDLY